VKHRILHLLAHVATIVVATCASAQAPFSLDTTFTTAIQSRNVNSVLPLPDGKIIVSGVMRFPGEFSDKRLVRLLPSGMRDETFYNSGLGGGAMKPWQDDRFYVATSQTVRRILPTGYQDPSFIEMNLGPYFSSLQGGDYHVFPDGRVLMSGAHILSDTARGFTGIHHLVWFSNQGYLDTTRVHRKGNGTVYLFHALPPSAGPEQAGKFICSGTCSQFDGQPVDRIFRVHADGSTDTTFRTGMNWASARCCLPHGDDGRVYIGGTYTKPEPQADTIRFARFMPDGSLDFTFSIPHFSMEDIPGQTWFTCGVSSAYPWVGGRLLLTGKFDHVNGQPRRGICMIDTTGALLPVFDDCGVWPYVYQTNPLVNGTTYASVSGIAPYGDEHYLIWGAYHGYSDGVIHDTLQRFVTRLHVGDFTTGASHAASASSFLLYPNPSSGSATLQLEHVPQDAQLVLRDALGREVLCQRVSGHYTSLQLNAFTDGLYAVELLSNGERMGTQRLVLQR